MEVWGVPAEVELLPEVGSLRAGEGEDGRGAVAVMMGGEVASASESGTWK